MERVSFECRRHVVSLLFHCNVNVDIPRVNWVRHCDGSNKLMYNTIIQFFFHLRHVIQFITDNVRHVFSTRPSIIPHRLSWNKTSGPLIGRLFNIRSTGICLYTTDCGITDCALPQLDMCSKIWWKYNSTHEIRRSNTYNACGSCSCCSSCGAVSQDAVSYVASAQKLSS